VVWSAHPLCTAEEIRTALQRSALKPWLTSPISNTSSAQQRTDRYGYGIVQGLAAHRYLQKNKCYGELAKSVLQLSVTPRTRKAGGRVTVSVTLRFAAAVSGASLPSVASRTVVVSFPASMMSCSGTRLTTNARGVASTTCKLLKSGSLTLDARLPSSSSWQAASTSQKVSVAK